jgi:hypothetical protein
MSNRSRTDTDLVQLFRIRPGPRIPDPDPQHCFLDVALKLVLSRPRLWFPGLGFPDWVPGLGFPDWLADLGFPDWVPFSVLGTWFVAHWLGTSTWFVVSWMVPWTGFLDWYQICRTTRLMESFWPSSLWVSLLDRHVVFYFPFLITS